MSDACWIPRVREDTGVEVTATGGSRVIPIGFLFVFLIGAWETLCNKLVNRVRSLGVEPLVAFASGSCSQFLQGVLTRWCKARRWVGV